MNGKMIAINIAVSVIGTVLGAMVVSKLKQAGKL